MSNLCKCGCGKQVTEGHVYARGHQYKDPANRDQMLAQIRKATAVKHSKIHEVKKQSVSSNLTTDVLKSLRNTIVMYVQQVASPEEIMELNRKIVLGSKLTDRLDKAVREPIPGVVKSSDHKPKRQYKSSKRNRFQSWSDDAMRSLSKFTEKYNAVSDKKEKAKMLTKFSREIGRTRASIGQRMYVVRIGKVPQPA